MSCNQTKSLLSPYLDGRVTGKQMQSVASHLSSCDQCHAQFRSLQQSQQLLTALRRKKAPPDLAFHIRLAISREASRTPSRRMRALLTQLENVFNPLLVPATAGVVSAIIFFGLLMGSLFTPIHQTDDNLPWFYSPPELQSSPFYAQLSTSPGPGSLTVVATVDETGRVLDYRVLSEPNEETALIMPELKNVLITSQFRPAIKFGKPTTDRVVLSFSKINVKG
jgi:hypothetical protein